MFEKAGFQDYISKPINIDRMEDTILKYIPLEMIKSGEAPEEAAPGAVVSMIIPGVNIHQGIEQCGGKLQNYLSLLSVVLLDGKKKLHLLDEYRESENYESYQIEAHAMKSVAASIGARTLSEIAKEQEFACREKRYQDVRDKHKKFYELYRMLLENIEVVLADNKYLFEQEQVKERGELNEALFCDRLRTILALLHDFEEDVAMRLIEEMDGYQLSQEQTAILEEIHGNMELFDYDEAEQFIQEQLKNEAEKKTESETGL